MQNKRKGQLPQHQQKFLEFSAEFDRKQDPARFIRQLNVYKNNVNKKKEKKFFGGMEKLFRL